MAAPTVREMMTTDVVHLQLDTTLDQAAKTMRDKDIGAVVVADDTRVVGLVTDRDIVIRAIADGLNPTDTTLDSVVSKDLVSVRPDDSVQTAALLMRDRAVRRMLVCDDHGLVGILSLGDLAVEIDPESVLGGISGADPNT